MNVDTLSKKPQVFSPTVAIVITGALALVLLSSLFWVPRAASTASLPWKTEFFSAVFLLCLVAACSYRKWVSPTSLPISISFSIPVFSLIAAFAVWSALSLGWAQFPLLSIHHTLSWGIYLAFMMLFVCLIRLGIGLKMITDAFALVALIVGISCLIDYMTMIDFASAEGPIRLRYGKFAELLLAFAPLLWSLTLYARGVRRIVLSIAAAILSWTVVLLSLSKGSFLFGIVGFAIFFLGAGLFSTRRIRKRLLVAAFVWLLLTGGIEVLFSAGLAIPSTTDYITGNADKTRSTTAMRIFTWNVAAEMVTRSWFKGIGADNFGVAFNPARAELNKEHQPPLRPEIVEDYVVERAHNEFLQILDELGIIGLLLIAAAFVSLAFGIFTVFRQNGNKLSPVCWAAVAGMTGFFGSSLVSSFSFRAVQNGIAFFLVCAIAVHEVAKKRRRKDPYISARINPNRIFAFAGVTAALMLVYCGPRGAAEYYLYRAERTRAFDIAEGYCKTSLKLDPGNAAAFFYLASRYAAEGDHRNAAALLGDAIDRGLGVSFTYSLLAKYQLLAGDEADSDKTLSRAIEIYPMSVFLRIRYATFLESTQKADEAANQLEVARSIDPRQANGWLEIIRNGSVAAYYKAQVGPGIAPPAELLPENAVLQYLDPTRFPDSTE